MKTTLVHSLILTALLLLGVPMAISAQRQTTLVNLAAVEGNKNINDIYLSSTMLKSSKLDFKEEGLPTFNEIFQKTDAIRIFTPANPTGFKELKEAFRPLLNSDKAHCERFMSINVDDAQINFLGLPKGKRFSPLYLLVEDASEMVVIIFVGEYTRQQIENLLAEGDQGKEPATQEKKKPAARD